MNDKLRPCPGCESKGDADDEVIGCLLVGLRYRCVCSCGWQGPSATIIGKAIAAWNTRPIEDALVEALKHTRNAMRAVMLEFGGKPGPVFMAAFSEALAALKAAGEQP